MCPLNTMSVVDSPTPADASTYAPAQRPDCWRTKALRYSALATSSLLASVAVMLSEATVCRRRFVRTQVDTAPADAEQRRVRLLRAGARSFEIAR